MLKDVTLNAERAEVNDLLWKDLLTYYFDANLDYRSTLEIYQEKADQFVMDHQLRDKNAKALLDVRSAMNEDLYVFTDETDQVDIFNFLLGFDNFFLSVKQNITNKKSTKFQRSKRLASPPLKAYEQVGHNKDLSDYKMNRFDYILE
ncbi:MAG: hypothetical protein QM781_08845 [Chitinophagaceae bacterium]